MPALFVDTGAFYAAADTSDEHHHAAAATFVARGRAAELVTSDYVFVETWMLVRARLGREAAIRWWDAMRTDVVRTFAFDTHFRVFRYGPDRRRAFGIVP